MATNAELMSDAASHLRECARDLKHASAIIDGLVDRLHEVLKVTRDYDGTTNPDVREAIDAVVAAVAKNSWDWRLP